MGNPESAPQPGRLKLIRTWYLLGGLMLLGVAALSLLPMPDTGVDDKLAHLLTYVFLGAWFGLLASSWRVLGATFAGLMVYGMLIELLQGMTLYRFAEWGDVIANISGLLIGVLSYFTPLTRVLAYIDQKLGRLLSR